MSHAASELGSLRPPQEGTAVPSGGREMAGESGVDGLQSSTETQAGPRSPAVHQHRLTAYCVLPGHFPRGAFQLVAQPPGGDCHLPVSLYFLLKGNCFTSLCSFLPDNHVNQS